MKILTITLFVTSCLVSEAMCMEQKNEHAHDLNKITITLGETSFQLSKDNLAQSGTLRNICNDARVNELDISDFCDEVNLSQETFAEVIIPALKDGENYTLSQNYSIKKLIKITDAANCLDMPHLLKAVIKNNAEYIIKNIDTFGEKNSSLCKFGTELPQDILEQIRRSLAPKIWETVSNWERFSSYKGTVTTVLSQNDNTPASYSTNSLASLAFSPDGKTLVSCSANNTIQLWSSNSIPSDPYTKVLGGDKGAIELWRILDFSFDQALFILYATKAGKPLNPDDLKDHLKKTFETFDDTQKQELTLPAKRKKPENQSFFYGNYWRMLKHGAIGTAMVLAYLFFKTKK